jgi:hypothetical protein
MWTDVVDSARWDRASGRSHRVATKVELWSEGQPVDEVPFIGGEVTDEHVTGTRRSLKLSVPPTRQWLRWLDMPVLELRPFRGIQWSRHRSEFCPLGRFPVLPPSRSYPSEAIQLSADDYWQRVQRDNFMGPTEAYSGLIRDVAEALIRESTGRMVVNTASSLAVAEPGRVWDKSRHDTIVEYLTSIAAEAWLDREGVPTIQDRAYGPTGGLVRDQEGGSLIAIRREPDWSKVVNTVGARSSAQGVDFGTAVAAVSDPAHPAHESRIGPVTMEFASPLLLTYAQGYEAARSLVEKHSAPAETYTISCVPDPRRDAGDVLPFNSPFGEKCGVIQKVTHPLGAGVQQITTGAMLTFTPDDLGDFLIIGSGLIGVGLLG